MCIIPESVFVILVLSGGSNALDNIRIKGVYMHEGIVGGVVLLQLLPIEKLYVGWEVLEWLYLCIESNQESLKW